jgi:SNF2 family DNA or RNA helicase
MTFEEVYEHLKKVREREDLTLKPNKFLREKIVDQMGREQDLKIRYYQVQGILHLTTMKRFILGDDTGLGKTFQSVAALSYVFSRPKTRKKAIIVTDRVAVMQWADEIHRFTEGIKTFPYSVTAKGGAVSPKKRAKIREEFFSCEEPCVLLTSYRTLVNDFYDFKDEEGLQLIFDECTAFKSPKTQVHKICYHLALKGDRVWGLSATIIKNNLVEGFGIYKVIKPDLFGSMYRFQDDYCVTKLQRIPGGAKIPIVVGHSKRHIKNFREKIDPYFLGRAKIDVAKELPTLTIKEYSCRMTPAQRKKYKEAMNGLLSVGGEEREVTPLTAVTYCQQIANHLELIEAEGDSGKMNLLFDLLKEGGEFHGQKVIVYTRFRSMVDILQRESKKFKLETLRITGSDSGADRKKAQEKFLDLESGSNVIFITSAAKQAINLQSAALEIFYDSPWSAGDYLQILGRMIRLGSVYDSVYAIHLVTEGSIDQIVMKRLQKKLNLVEDVLGRRIKGEEEETASSEDAVALTVDSDVNEIFDMMVEGDL